MTPAEILREIGAGLTQAPWRAIGLEDFEESGIDDFIVVAFDLDGVETFIANIGSDCFSRLVNQTSGAVNKGNAYNLARLRNALGPLADVVAAAETLQTNTRCRCKRMRRQCESCALRYDLADLRAALEVSDED